MKPSYFLSIVLPTIILLFGCASAALPVIYIPTVGQQVHCFYRNGQPIISASIDSILTSFTIEPSVRVAGRNYCRLWIMVNNTSQREFLVDPPNSLSLVAIFNRKAIDTLHPTPRTQILTSIDNESAVIQIVQSIGSTLKALATEPTTITDSRGNSLQINDRQAKIDEVNRQSRAEIASTSRLYEAFKASVNAGILRRNTLFPGQGINGFVYFQMPVPPPYLGELHGFKAYDLQLRITTPLGSRAIDLEHAKGD
jgi:hypothetical protein